MEASDRVGGRIHTYYGNGWYADLGAMRFPRDHVLLPGVRCRNSKSFKADCCTLREGVKVDKKKSLSKKTVILHIFLAY